MKYSIYLYALLATILFNACQYGVAVKSINALESRFSPHLIEGELAAVPGTKLMEDRPSGLPVGIKEGDLFTLFLIDPKIFSEDGLDLEFGSRLRAYGLSHDHGRSFTPFRIEVWDDLQWKALDLPFSGWHQQIPTNISSPNRSSL